MNKINSATKQANSELQSADIELMKSSSHSLFGLYCNNKTHVLPEAYLNADLCMPNKQLKLQLKTKVPHICHEGKVARPNAMQAIYGKISSSTCSICEFGTEDSYHILYECHAYRTERLHYLSQFLQPTPDRLIYLKDFNNMTMDKCKNLFAFFSASLKKREHIINQTTGAAPI